MNQCDLVGVSKADRQSTINMFQVFGERRSGTNYLETLIARNTALQPVRRFGWKHGVPAFPVFPASCLFIVIVRDPKDWLTSFYRAPFEVDKSVAKLPFSEFIRAEWESVYTPKSSGWAGNGYEIDNRLGRGEILQLDRHPIEGRRFRNVLELRSVKLAGHLSLLARGINALAVRYEDIRGDATGLLHLLNTTFGIEPTQAHTPILNSVGPKPVRQKTDVPVTEEDLGFIRDNLDLTLESRCGYSV